MPAPTQQKRKGGYADQAPRGPGPGLKGTEVLARGTRKSAPDAQSIIKGLDHLLRIWEMNRQYRLRGVNGSREDRLRGLFGGGR